MSKTHLYKWKAKIKKHLESILLATFNYNLGLLFISNFFVLNIVIFCFEKSIEINIKNITFFSLVIWITSHCMVISLSKVMLISFPTYSAFVWFERRYGRLALEYLWYYFIQHDVNDAQRLETATWIHKHTEYKQRFINVRIHIIYVRYRDKSLLHQTHFE